MADTQVLGTCARKGVEVQLLSLALFQRITSHGCAARIVNSYDVVRRQYELRNRYTYNVTELLT